MALASCVLITIHACCLRLLYNMLTHRIRKTTTGNIRYVVCKEQGSTAGATVRVEHFA